MVEITREISIDTPKKQIYSYLIDYPSYPDYMLGVDSIKVGKKLDKLRSLVVYKVLMFGKEVTYTVKMTEKPFTGVSWKLHESEYLEKNSGGWVLTQAAKNQTDVIYNLSLELVFPVPSFLLRKHVNKQVDKMLEEFKTYCESQV